VELTKYLAEGPWKGRHGPQNIHNIAVITRPWQAQGQLDSLEPSRLAAGPLPGDARRDPVAGPRVAVPGTTMQVGASAGNPDARPWPKTRNSEILGRQNFREMRRDLNEGH